ncbi:class I SAM-dependent methyltransferase [Paragemmobacter straminiformis]|uniref:Class I SAM-dependent methyltransferase n=1 Tax=Paragemmobacter straminiformis TaxID=2045119 RepID=A0A842I6U3_9RHOB|nr:class I SAM-dependent methyltransferase [Gemmobacter straminiformis]MBC2835123.1 class I SAM-dependent methyltransferase [Gemmobacter straminiformis]
MTSYAELTHENPSRLKRFSHKSRFHRYCKFIGEASAGRTQLKLLDYGAGDGYLFAEIARRQIGSYELWAYEPVESQYLQLTETVSKLDLEVNLIQELEEFYCFDVIICAEVLEHFTAIEAVNHLTMIKNALSPNGKLLISVPIETGFSGFFKNIFRMLIGQAHSGTGFRDIFRSLFSKPKFRGNTGYIPSHVGFCHKNIEYLLIDSGFSIEKKYFSPFPIFGEFLNSQVYFSCTLRK